jgi:hypothetical protein
MLAVIDAQRALEDHGLGPVIAGLAAAPVRLHGVCEFVRGNPNAQVAPVTLVIDH